MFKIKAIIVAIIIGELPINVWKASGVFASVSGTEVRPKPKASAIPKIPAFLLVILSLLISLIPLIVIIENTDNVAPPKTG